MSTSNIPQHAFSNILAIADETEQAEAQLKRQAHELLMTRQHVLLEQMIERWLKDPPQQVLEWLRKQAPGGGGST